ncbi:hypothetical protein [Ferrimicrobium acidiphilum]|uniref:hypothetical protein n=1 Tax=Ferrimicrobium acidiphilum TaxID=121039 RepID=UPI0034DD71E4
MYGRWAGREYVIGVISSNGWPCATAMHISAIRGAAKLVCELGIYYLQEVADGRVRAIVFASALAIREWCAS